MKLAFPVEADNGLQSELYGNFGDTPGFVLYDTDSDESKYIENADLCHKPNSCNPAGSFGDEKVDAVIVSGIGPAPLKKLQAAGIQVISAGVGDVAENVALFRSGSLICLTANLSCSKKNVSCMCDCL